MSVLSRRANESIVIGQDISISIIGVRGNRVRIGVTAPGEVSILRHEHVAQHDPDEHGQSDMWSPMVNSDTEAPSTVGTVAL
jgi:carbon storage regulator